MPRSQGLRILTAEFRGDRRTALSGYISGIPRREATPVAEPRIVHGFADVPDPRIDRTQRHARPGVRLITRCAVLVGAESWDTVATFGTSKHDGLKRVVPLADGLPAPGTFERVFARLDPKAFQTCVVAWLTGVRGATGIEYAAIDGKAVRGDKQATFSGCRHLVSAGAVANRRILGQRRWPTSRTRSRRSRTCRTGRVRR